MALLNAPSDSAFVPFEIECDEEVYEQISDERERVFGRYRLSHQIASGGMATVYLGRAIGPGGFDRPVAIKRIHPHLARKTHYIEMFLDEARIAARIHHPNVCSVYDFGEVRGTYFIAMEYLAGCHLATLMRAVASDPERRLSNQWVALAVRIAMDVCEALHATHEVRDEQGDPLEVVHRDVSPQNVFITYAGAVKLMDFGVAFARKRLHQTTTGALKGKFSYMAPEHASGDGIDRRADIWSLGVCLWEMLTSQRLFRTNSEMETMMAVQSQPLMRPSQVQRFLPPELDEIVMRALRRDRDERYPTARAFGQELGQFLRTLQEPAGLADLAEWVEPIVADERARKEEVLRIALQPQYGETPLAEVPTNALGTYDGSYTTSEAGDIDEPVYAPVAKEESSRVTSRIESDNDPSTITHLQAGVTGKDPETAPLYAPSQLSYEVTGHLPAESDEPLDDEKTRPAASLSETIHEEETGKFAAIPVHEKPRTHTWVMILFVSGAAALLGAGGALLHKFQVDREEPVAEVPVVEDVNLHESHDPVTVVAPTPALEGHPNVEGEVGAIDETEPPSEYVPEAKEQDTRARVETNTERQSRRKQRSSHSTKPGNDHVEPANAQKAPSTPPTPTEVATPPAPAEGGVDIVAVGGWADVYEDSRSLGRTPRRVKLSAGRHQLEIRPFGRTPAKKISVVVQANAVVRLAVPIH